MQRLFPILLFISLSTVIAGCMGNKIDPISSDAKNIKDFLIGSIDRANSYAQNHLWGYYDVEIDLESQTATAVLNRNAMFTANVVNFLNGNPPKLSFHINSTPMGPDYVDVDIDVSITHPFAGLTQYNGYDVRGVFMGDGSGMLDYNSDLDYPVNGIDQIMLADPDDGVGGADGYTRWFNRTEFSTGGMPLFSYTPGNMASPGFKGNATLCPYKYYADGLGKDDDLFAWLDENPEKHGVFSAGATNTRNYYLRFPTAKGVKYGYAVAANWGGLEPEFHPSNAHEAVAVKIVDNSTVYYAGPSDKGGKLIIDASIWDWNTELSAGIPEDYKLIVESTVLSSPYEIPDMTPIGGNENYSTFHVEIEADNVTGISGNEFWVIAECLSDDYKNNFGVTNLAGDDPLAAFFRFDLDVSSAPGNHDPVCDVEVVTQEFTGWLSVDVEFDASGSYDPDGDSLNYEWDFNGDGVYGGAEDSYSGSPENPTHTYMEDYVGVVRVKVTDGQGGEAICETEELNINVIDCGTPDMPSGGLTEWDKTGPSLYMASGIIKVKGASKEYGVSWVYDYISQIDPIQVKYGLTSFELTGSGFSYNQTNKSQIYGEMIRPGGICSDSTNRIYGWGLTGDPSFDTTRIYYSDWSETTGFTIPVLLASWLPAVTPWTIINMTIDENDNPVLLCFKYSSPQLCIKHWNGSSWNEIAVDDWSTIMTENFNNRYCLYDFAYQPVSKTYWITNRANQYYNSGLGDYYWQGTPTIYCIASDGSTAWKDTDFYSEIADTIDAGAFMTGVYVDTDDPDCRTLVEIGCYAWVFNPGPPPGVFDPRSVRYDPYGTNLGHSDMPYPNLNGYYQYAIGSVMTWNGASYYTCPTNFDLLGTLEIPDW